MAPPSYPAGPSNYATNGSTQRDAIDLTNRPSPPPAPPQPSVDRKPLCIGAIQSKVTMIYPSPAVVIGKDVQSSRENLVVIPYRGAEMLKVRLKASLAKKNVEREAYYRSTDKPECPCAIMSRWLHKIRTSCRFCLVSGLALAGFDTSAASSIYIGELDQNAQRVFLPLLQRGLIRLEGYVQRIHPDAVSSIVDWHRAH